MKRLVVGFAIGFALLLVGLGALFGLILDEREQALAQLDAQSDAVAERAGERLRDRLYAELERLDQRVEAVLADPLDHAWSPDLVLIDDGRVILPPRPATKPARARAILTALDAGRPIDGAEPELLERIELARNLPETYPAWLEHRRHFVLRAGADLATTLFALERLAAARAFEPERARQLMREIASDAAGAPEGFLVALLRARSHLSEDELQLLLQRSVPLAKRALVRVDDVLERAQPPAFAVPGELLPPRWAPSPGMIAGDWLARGDERRVMAARFDLHQTLAELQPALGLPSDVTLEPRHDEGPVDAISVDARAPSWDAAGSEIQRRFAFKLIPLAGVAALAVVVFVLALSLQRRRAAYLDLRSHLLAAVTHELKTPLASIRAMAETLELRLADHHEARDYPRRIVASSERLEFLVDNVLSFARLERDAWRPEMSVLAVADLAAWLAGDPVARAVRPIELEVDVPAGLSLEADRDLVRLLLSNLVDNAAKYAIGERVTVGFSAREDGREVRLAVRDDGPGLGDLDPRDVFRDFRRGRVNGVRGTGLGLSICRMVMSLHGGSIEVASSSKSGTEFVATFPQSRSSGRNS